MRKVDHIESIVIPLDRMNVDTDAIIPKQFLKSVKRTGFGPNLFDDWRYLDPGDPGIDNDTRRLNPDFVLNQQCYKGVKILLGRENFGCGSSREHAVWALDDYGIRAVIAPSFADIFYNNCFKNALLPVVLTHDEVDQLFELSTHNEGLRLSVDLPGQLVTASEGQQYSFEIDAFRKHCLIEGLDDISLTMEHLGEIKAYEKKQRETTPWMFPA